MPAMPRTCGIETEYRVALAGLPIAHADFKTEVIDKHFTIKGTSIPPASPIS